MKDESVSHDLDQDFRGLGSLFLWVFFLFVGLGVFFWYVCCGFLLLLCFCFCFPTDF